MLVSMHELLKPTREHGFAIGAFNVADSCFIRAVVEEAEATNTPAIISIHPSEHDFVGDAFLATCGISPSVAACLSPCIWIMAPRWNMFCAPFSVASPRS